jgi:hypothetical protein
MASVKTQCDQLTRKRGAELSSYQRGRRMRGFGTKAAD